MPHSTSRVLYIVLSSWDQMDEVVAPNGAM